MLGNDKHRLLVQELPVGIFQASSDEVKQQRIDADKSRNVRKRILNEKKKKANLIFSSLCAEHC